MAQLRYKDARGGLRKKRPLIRNLVYRRLFWLQTLALAVTLYLDREEIHAFIRQVF